MAIMPRPKAILQSEFPYHISARCVNKEWFALPMQKVWEIMERHLYFLCIGFNVRIHLFVLMNNHFHLILSTPSANISQSMAYFMKATSDEITYQTGRINQTYGARHYKTIIKSHHYFLNAYKYVYRNPVDAGLAKRVELYPYSTLSGLLGYQPLLIPLEEDSTLFSDELGTIKWLNESPCEQDRHSVREALKKQYFTLSNDRVTRRRNNLEIDLL